MNLSEKLKMAAQLDALGVDVIEAGFAISSPGDFAAVKGIASVVKRAVVASLARAVKKDIEEGTVRQVPLDQPIRRNLNVIYHKSKFLTDNMRSFIDLCKKYGKSVK